MRFVKLVSGFVLAFIMVASFSLAKPEYAKKEGNKPCTSCHIKAGSKDLNEMGKCYKENDHSLAKCSDKKGK